MRRQLSATPSLGVTYVHVIVSVLSQHDVDHILSSNTIVPATPTVRILLAARDARNAPASVGSILDSSGRRPELNLGVLTDNAACRTLIGAEPAH